MISIIEILFVSTLFYSDDFFPILAQKRASLPYSDYLFLGGRSSLGIPLLFYTAVHPTLIYSRNSKHKKALHHKLMKDILIIIFI